jgi:hypothetical protein
MMIRVLIVQFGMLFFVGSKFGSLLRCNVFFL